MAEAIIRVFRGNAESGELVEYRVPSEKGEVVLDILLRIQASKANDLAIRWNCRQTITLL